MENRKIALDEVEHRFYKLRKARNTVETLVKDRQKGANKAADFLLDCDAFRESGKDRAISLSGMITSKADSEAMLEARTTCADMWKKRFDHQVLRKRGMRQTKGRIPVFKVRASNEKGRKTAKVKEYKDTTLVAS